MSVSVGDRRTLEITALAHGGYGLARVEGFVVFVPGALPGERVIAEVYKKAKSHAFADLLEVTSAHPQRVPHFWPEADHTRPPGARAGGADFGHIALDFQRELKAGVLRDALIRMGRVEAQQVASLSVQGLPGHPDGTRYRTRVTLHVDSEGRAGPFAERSHTVIPVASLPLATSEMQQLGAHQAVWSGPTQIRLLHPSGGEARIVEASQPPQPITESVSGMSFALDDRVFWQVHRHAPQALTEAISGILSGLEVPPDAEHWDLYGGVGLFARTLIEWAGPDAPVHSVESDPVASGFAAVNLAPFPTAHARAMQTKDFLHQRGAQIGAEARGPLGVALLDPPRSGAGREVISAITRATPQAIVYVACDPVALARDVATLHEEGYRLESIRAFDLFPHTHHVEAVGLFVPH